MKVLLSILFAATLLAQGPMPLPPSFAMPWQQLKQFLDLTPDQLTKLMMNGTDFSRWNQTKYQRMAQVKQEIAQATAPPARWTRRR